MFFSFVPCLIFLPEIAPQLQAQNDAAGDSSYTLRITTQRVLLDVVVKDKKGNLIPYLSPKDFTVYEDNVVHPITSFDAPTPHAQPKPENAIVHGSADLAKIGAAPITILVLDELNTSFEDMSFARQKMEKYLDTQPAILTQPTALLAVTNTHFQVIEDYTQDREALRLALKKHFPELPLKYMQSGANSSGAYERMALSLNSLHQIAVAARGAQGRKSVIWVGKGFPAVNLLVLDNESTEVMQHAIQRLTRELMDTRMTLYTIDPAANLLTHGFVATPDELTEFESRTDGQPFADEIKFSTLAPATGGQAFYDRNDVDKELREAAEEGATYYALSYAPTNHIETPGAYRHIHVVLKDPNLIAVTRNGYYVGDAEDNVFDAVKNQAKDLRTLLEEEMGSAAIATLPYSGVGASLAKGDGDALTLKTTAGTLAWTPASDGKYQAEITVLSVAFSAKGKALAHTSKELVAQVRGEVTNPELKAAFLLHLPQPVGTKRIRVVVRDAHNGKIGTAELQLP